MIGAACHCGNIKFTTSKLPSSITSCNCSICNRYGALWAYYSPIDVDIHENKISSIYSWGERDIEFHYCNICGCLTHYISVKKYKGERIAINARMMSLDSVAKIRVRKFDDAVSWKYIDE